MRFAVPAVVLLACSYRAPNETLAEDASTPDPDGTSDIGGPPDAAPDTITPICAGYTAAGDSNHLVITTPADWPTARQTCNTIANGHLVVIADATENALVRDMIADPTRFWMGFSDRDVENTWKWLDDTDVSRAPSSGIRVSRTTTRCSAARIAAR